MPLLTRDNEDLARDYDALSANRQFKSGKQLVQALAIQPGERVLDVGCGTGRLAEFMAEQAGPTGHVLGIDPLPLRINLAQARGRDGLSFRVGDAYELDDLPQGGFDVVCLNAVFHWLPEKTGPLRQFARILNSGGRLGISTGLKGHPNPVRETAAAILARPPFAAHPRGEAADHRVDLDEMRRLLGDAGFRIALLETRLSEHVFPTPEAVLRYAEASSFGNLFGHLPDGLRPAARAAIREALAAVATPDGIPMSTCRIVAVAMKP
jgi:arsenite methyltransferase